MASVICKMRDIQSQSQSGSHFFDWVMIFMLVFAEVEVLLISYLYANIAIPLHKFIRLTHRGIISKS